MLRIQQNSGDFPRMELGTHALTLSTGKFAFGAIDIKYNLMDDVNWVRSCYNSLGVLGSPVKTSLCNMYFFQ